MFDNQVRDSGTSALPLFDELQTSFGNHLGKSPLNIHRSEQRDTPTSEPLLREPRKLLERVIPGGPKQLDCSRRLSESYATRQVVNDGAPARA